MTGFYDSEEKNVRYDINNIPEWWGNDGAILIVLLPNGDKISCDYDSCNNQISFYHDSYFQSCILQRISPMDSFTVWNELEIKLNCDIECDENEEYDENDRGEKYEDIETRETSSFFDNLEYTYSEQELNESKNRYGFGKIDLLPGMAETLVKFYRMECEFNDISEELDDLTYDIEKKQKELDKVIRNYENSIENSFKYSSNSNKILDGITIGVGVLGSIAMEIEKK